MRFFWACISGGSWLFMYAISQLQSMEPRWNLSRAILDPNDDFFKTFSKQKLWKKILFPITLSFQPFLFLCYLAFQNLTVIHIEFHQHISNVRKLERFRYVQNIAKLFIKNSNVLKSKRMHIFRWYLKSMMKCSANYD